VVHILDHKETFNVSDKDIKESVEKVWPCFFITLKQELTRPLEDKITNLKGWLKCMSKDTDDLESSLRDVSHKNGQLINQCRVKDKALQAMEQECELL
jgi:hypothetical protein